MIGLIQSTEDQSIAIIGAEKDERLREQIEKILGTQISSTAWAKLYLDREIVDFGNCQIALFETNSIIQIKGKAHTTMVLSVDRDQHNLGH